jgi:hypothetical protein
MLKKKLKYAKHAVTITSLIILIAPFPTIQRTLNVDRSCNELGSLVSEMKHADGQTDAHIPVMR